MAAFPSGKTYQEKVQFLTGQLEKSKILAIFTLKDPNMAVDVAKALLAGGITMMEVTYRTEAAALALKKISAAKLPISIGGGTIRTVEQAQSAIESGAEFFVTPGFNPKIVQWAIDHDIPIFPGIDSTLGIEQALDFGFKVLKYFPADIGGAKWLKAINGPYADVKFIPTGGVSISNMGEFLALPNVIAIAGSFLVPAEAITTKQFNKITEVCQEALKLIEKSNSKV